MCSPTGGNKEIYLPTYLLDKEEMVTTYSWMP